MFEFFIKFTYQISVVIDYFFSIVVYIFIIGKNLNCLLSFSMLLCFNWCRRNHTHLRFYKFIICSVIRTGFFISLLMTAVTISLLKVLSDLSPRISFSVISLTFCIISAVLVSVFDSVMERRDLKASLVLI